MEKEFHIIEKNKNPCKCSEYKKVLNDINTILNKISTSSKSDSMWMRGQAIKAIEMIKPYISKKEN